MKKDKTQPGNTDPPPPEETEAGTPEPQPGQADQLAAAENRIAELSAELEELRASTERQLTALRAENAAQLAAYSELARGLPGLVPELVGGSSLEAVQGSVVAAREAYSRIAASLTPAEDAGKGPGSFMGAGGGTRGGQAVASFLDRALPRRVIPFVFSSFSKSELGWNFCGVIDSGRFKDYADDGAADTAWWWRQLAAVEYEVRPGPGQLLRWSVPDPALHDDLVISAALVAVLDEQDWRSRKATGTGGE